jgi:hypothetical protein
MDKYLELKKIITLRKYHMPIDIDKDCLHQGVDSLFREYLNDIKDLVEEYYFYDIKSICDGIIECLENYYSGYIDKAYSVFSDKVGSALENNYVFYSKSIEGSNYIDPLDLYRVRKYKENDDFSIGDIFHVPFSKRRHVSSSRFSIAGYPCLYLGTSIDLSRIESGIEKKDSGIVSKFKLNRNFDDTKIRIRVLDLAIKPIDIAEGRTYFHTNNLDNLIYYLRIYPLIAACSIMAKRRDVPFIPEYIVPQMLMQWLRENSTAEEVTGVRYFSCRSLNPRIKGYNYVFPVTYISDRMFLKDLRFCGVLSRCFKLTYPKIYGSFSNPLDIEGELSDNKLIFMN